MNINIPVNYVRIERTSTHSWMTFHTEKPVHAEELEAYLSKVMPGWEWNGAASEHDPDNEDGELVEIWREQTWDGKVWETTLVFED